MTDLLSSELFPTVCRSTAQGMAATPGRLVAVPYSYIMQLGNGIIISCDLFLFELNDYGQSITFGIADLNLTKT